MSSLIFTNQELELAESFVEQTRCHVFLTGKAGTGKTTFLKTLQEKTEKRLVVTAPTGVAAINAGGVTLHSFFQLPLGVVTPELERSGKDPAYPFKISKQKKEILKHLDLLVIDEISMVRADILDAVSSVLCRFRNNPQPFGGVQLLMIGDLHQLPPVAKREEWEILRRHYDSVYFFSSKSLKQAGYIGIELQHIYRQTDERFIHILNQVRNNCLDDNSVAVLNERYRKNFVPADDQKYITLTTHNASAAAINDARLDKLEQKAYRFEAEIKGDFPKHSYPAPVELTLKKGAQVMFLRNDNTSEKRYFNGKIGIITKIGVDAIRVTCPGDSEAIDVETCTWENIRYAINKDRTKIESDVVGTFKQFPLKPAWAITIHKSQGLTFEKAIIDAEDAFTHGQTYVALSRCKTLEGVVLSSPISRIGIRQDRALRDFDAGLKQNQPTEELLNHARTEFQQSLLLDCFDFRTLKNHLYQAIQLLRNNVRMVHGLDPADRDQILEKAVQDLFPVAEKFQMQLQRLFQNGNLPESDPLVLERISKASGWFQEKFSEIFGDFPGSVRLITDNTPLKAKITDALQRLQIELAVRQEGIKTLENGFDPSDYLHRTARAKAGMTADKKNAPESSDQPDAEHPELLTELKKWRLRKSERTQTARHHILQQKALYDIVSALPDTPSQLRKIKGIGKKTVKKYGQEIVSIISRYKKKHKITNKETIEDSQRHHEKQNGRVTPTKNASFDLFRQGMTIDEIARHRGLAQTTIEGHLCVYIEQGKLDINSLLPREKREAILNKLKTQNHQSLSEIKDELGDDYSYGQIRMALAWKHYQDSS